MYHGRPWGSQDRMLEELKCLSLCQVSGGQFEEGGSLWIGCGEKEVIQGLTISGILVQNGGRLTQGSS